MGVVAAVESLADVKHGKTLPRDPNHSHLTTGSLPRGSIPAGHAIGDSRSSLLLEQIWFMFTASFWTFCDTAPSIRIKALLFSTTYATSAHFFLHSATPSAVPYRAKLCAASFRLSSPGSLSSPCREAKRELSQVGGAETQSDRERGRPWKRSFLPGRGLT